jgi:hypothetical protein
MILMIGERDSMSGSGRRDRISRDVISGFERQCVSISEPMKPDAPASMYFMTKGQ